MKKQKKIMARTSRIVLGLGRLGANLGGRKTAEEVPEGRLLRGNESIKLSEPKFARNADGTFTETVHYTIEPAGIIGLSFYTTLDWVQDERQSCDWKTVDNSKKVEDYVTYSRDTSKQTISFTCKKEFGRPRQFDMAVQEDTSKTAQIQIDYSRKRLEKAKVIRNVEEFTDGKPVYIKIQKAKWSVGSIGSTTETEKVEIGYKGDTIATLLGSIQEPNSSGYISYQGKNYASASGVRTAIADNYYNYLRECISDDNPSCFNKDHLKELGKYSYTHFGTRNVRTNFITNYRAAASISKGGFYIKVTVSNEIIYNKMVSFSQQADRLDDIKVDSQSVVF